MVDGVAGPAVEGGPVRPIGGGGAARVVDRLAEPVDRAAGRGGAAGRVGAVGLGGKAGGGLADAATGIALGVALLRAVASVLRTRAAVARLERVEGLLEGRHGECGVVRVRAAKLQGQAGAAAVG